MQIEIIGYEEKRTIQVIWNAKHTCIKRLIPAKRTRRVLQLRFPDGSVETVRASKAVLAKYIAAQH